MKLVLVAILAIVLAVVIIIVLVLTGLTVAVHRVLDSQNEPEPIEADQ